MTQCCSSACPPSATLAQHQPRTGQLSRVCWAAFYSSWSGIAYCWRRLQADTDPMSVNCWASVAVLASIYSVLVSTSCCQCRHTGVMGTMHWTKAWLMSALRLWRWPTSSVVPNTTHWPNTGLMLAQRRRRWANISPALDQHLVFDRLRDSVWPPALNRSTEMNGTYRCKERTDTNWADKLSGQR